MKNKKALVIILAAIGFILVGCSPIRSGVITAKEFEPSRSYITTQCHLVGKVTHCTPITNYDDEDWRFDIKSEKDEGYVYVTPEEFEQYEVGDYYDGEAK